MSADKSKAYFGMGFSAILYFAIGFITYYKLLQKSELTNKITEFVYGRLIKFSFITDPIKSKVFLLIITVAAVMLYYPKKKESATYSRAIMNFVGGMICLFLSGVMTNTSSSFLSFLSFLVYTLGYVLSIFGSLEYFQIIKLEDKSKLDPFNEENETFLQTEQKIDTEHSVNIPYKYQFEKKMRTGWINFINLFRALLIIGTPGSGKSFALIEEIIFQMLSKFFTLVIYDFKFDTLTKIAYNYLVKLREKYKDDPEKLKKLPELYVICLDNPEKSNRCNPIDPYFMKVQTDAADASTSIMKNLNREWIRKNDFFSRSAISFVSGLIWYLKKVSEKRGKNYCTLPHVIMLSTVNIEYLLTIMLVDMEVRNLLIPFKDALEREAGQQLAGQTASAQISLSMLANKEIFYVMSGNDFRLDVNNPDNPKIVCIQNNPDRAKVYAAPIGLYINKILQIVNKPDQRPLGVILDELPTIFIMNLRSFIDTARSNYCATIMGIQSIAQMIADYGKELADVLYDNSTNVFCGSAKGITAKYVSEIFGKTNQKNVTSTINSNDTSMNISTQPRELLPVSKIATMSTGTFAGITADTFENPIKQKLCYGEIIANMENKKIQNKHEVPLVKDFKPDNYDKTIKEKLELLENIQFYEKVVLLDTKYPEYIDFYNTYIENFANEQYEDEFFCEQFVSFIKELKVYDHLHYIRKFSVDDSITMEELQMYFAEILNRQLIEQNKDHILAENFLDIIKDIDDLVQLEYYNIKGEIPEFTIFDDKKINGDIGNVIEDEASLANDFMKDINKIDTVDILNMFDTSVEKKKTTFETDMISESKESAIENSKDVEDYQESSFPIDTNE